MSLNEVVTSSIAEKNSSIITLDSISTENIHLIPDAPSSLLGSLSLIEKVELLSGGSFVATTGNSRVGIPALKVSYNSSIQY
jgi:hypothetical protein